MKSNNHQTWKYLEPHPKSFYKQLFVKGTRIRAEILFGWTVDGSEPMTPEEVADSYGLPLEAVQEAIAYCQSDPPEMAEDLAKEKAHMMDPERFLAHHSPSKILPWKFLEARPQSGYQQLFVKGTAYRSDFFYRKSADGPERMTPEELADFYVLPVAVVQEAIAYCQSNPFVLAEDQRKEQRMAAQKA
jgi:uncharacterized protein (DUF433 family)